MARILEPGDGFDDDAFDLSDLCCPRCRSNDVHVTRYPRPGWWGAQAAKARCHSCGAVFGVRAIAPRDTEADEADERNET